MRNVSILELIPQRPPFVFVDEIVDVTENSIKTLYRVKRDSPLSEGDLFSEAGMIECIAQTIATHIGYTTLGEVTIGVIGSVRNFKIVEIPKVDDILIAEVDIVNKVFNITFVHAKIFLSGKEIAGGELKVALQE